MPVSLEAKSKLPTFGISVDELESRVGRPATPIIIDVCRRPALASRDVMVPTAIWRDVGCLDQWINTVGEDADVVVHCVHGHNVSQMVAGLLRRRRVRAQVLVGGIEAWCASCAPTIGKSLAAPIDTAAPRVWVGDRTVTPDLLASVWLLKRFIDRHAHVIFVDQEQVDLIADELNGRALAVAEADAGAVQGSAYSCLLHASGLQIRALNTIASMLRERPAIDPRFELAAVFDGIIASADGDADDACARAFVVFDALYASATSQTAATVRGGQ